MQKVDADKERSGVQKSELARNGGTSSFMSTGWKRPAGNWSENQRSLGGGLRKRTRKGPARLS